MKSTKKMLALVVAGMILLFAACGGKDGDSNAGGEHQGGGGGGGGGHAAGQDDPSMGDEGFAFGEPADPADADRTIEVAGTDELRFDPDKLEIKAGETIAFEFKNAGDLTHEFMLGDKETLGGHSGGGDPSNGTGEVPGGGSETIAWTFSQPGELAFECHVDNHNEAGMRGTITVN